MVYENLLKSWLKSRCAFADGISPNLNLKYFQMVVSYEDQKCLILLSHVLSGIFFVIREKLIHRELPSCNQWS